MSEMQPVGNIMPEVIRRALQEEKHLKTANSSGKSSDSQDFRYITLSEAKKLGITTEDIIPQKCEFCGRKLEATGLLINILGRRKWLHRTSDYESCDCSGAEEYRKKLWKEAEERRERERERAYKEKIDRMIQKSKLGKRFKSRTFGSFQINEKNREAFETAKQYADEFAKYKETGTGLLLTGTYGTGKTHLAAAICHELIRNNYQPIFGTMISLLGNIKSTYNDERAEETENQILNKYINCDLLIIDDLGKERPTEWALEKLYYVINSRYEDCKPIVITTNYADKLVNRLTCKDNIETAKAIVSRIYEMCVGVLMTWEDYRRL